MSKTVSGMVVTDVSAFAKSIRRELLARETGTDHRPVSHLELLNILARSAGFRNFQHLKASDRKVDTGFRTIRCEEEASCGAAESPLDARETPEPEPVDHRKIEQILRCFDASGVLLRWPKKTSHQRLALWWCWAAMPSRRDLTEPEVNVVLKALNGFGDHVLMRREMIDWGMMTRSLDCKVYRRVETKPPAEAASLIARLQERKRAGIVPRPSGREQFRLARMQAPPAASPTSP
ncbi:DUF2087 domain-containing protein [Rhizobium rhizoryzae]|uniref:DUF2087 domain-containing protein n=1 Tax=Rhizobium rhizoryzae TaxID=451876 RepID=A0A7W6LGM2_9HYPH|nr:DUF2087 domain-containing protein [Rhizobium rhizoryzae]MBB4142867.1 hypothetical protein [Rhizobium rhizoryzae]